MTKFMDPRITFHTDNDTATAIYMLSLNSRNWTETACVKGSLCWFVCVQVEGQVWYSAVLSSGTDSGTCVSGTGSLSVPGQPYVDTQ